MNRTKLFETERLVLRRFEKSDAENMFKNYCNDDEVTKYLRWKSHKTVEDTISYVENFVLPDYENEFVYRWAIVLKDIGEVIGCIDVVELDNKKKSVELGWVIGKEYWGRGIMPEAGIVVRDYLFDEGFVRVSAHHNVENKKSGRVMEKIGMTYEGRLHKYSFNNEGELVDVDVYAIINEKAL